MQPTIADQFPHIWTVVYAVIAAFLASFGGVYTALRLGSSQKRKLKADAVQVEMLAHNEAVELYLQMMKQVRETQEAIDDMREEKNDAEARANESDYNAEQADQRAAAAESRAAVLALELDQIRNALPREVLSEIFKLPVEKRIQNNPPLALPGITDPTKS